VDSETLTRIREEYRARVAARRERSNQTEQSHQTEKDIDPRNIEEVRRRAVQSWLEMRSKGAEDTQPATRQERSKDRENER
jgi:hypothetical protein